MLRSRVTPRGHRVGKVDYMTPRIYFYININRKCFESTLVGPITTYAAIIWTIIKQPQLEYVFIACTIVVKKKIFEIIIVSFSNRISNHTISSFLVS